MGFFRERQEKARLARQKAIKKAEEKRVREKIIREKELENAIKKFENNLFLEEFLFFFTKKFFFENYSKKRLNGKVAAEDFLLNFFKNNPKFISKSLLLKTSVGESVVEKNFFEGVSVFFQLFEEKFRSNPENKRFLEKEDKKWRSKNLWKNLNAVLKNAKRMKEERIGD